MKSAAHKNDNHMQRLLFAFNLVALLIFFHHTIFRPLILDCGAPKHLREMTFSGDYLTQGTSHSRAVLINASPGEIWPWLTQVGQDRGGFYSYQWLENIFRADMRNVKTIRPEFQYPRMQGDTIWMANKDHYSGRGYKIVAEAIPFKSIVMVGGDDYTRLRTGGKAKGSWAFYLHPETPERTWLIARSSQGETNFGNRALRYFFYEVPHFIMERKMLMTMRKLAEKERLNSRNEVISDNS